jgi:hypothetical protein
MSKTRKQRSAAELIAEAQAQLEKRLARAARKEALSDPTMSPLVERIDELKKAQREAKKLLGDGAQSAKVRIAKHEDWIARIEAEAAEASHILSDTEREIAEVEAQISAAIQAKTAEA